MKSKILFLTSIFAALNCSFADDNLAQVNEIKGIAESLIATKANIEKNSEYEIIQYMWKTDVNHVSQIRGLLNGNAFSAEAPLNVEQASQNAEKVIRKLNEILSVKKNEAVKWKILFYNGMTKFNEEFVTVSDGQVRPKEQTQGAFSGNGNQYLFSDTTSYLFQPSRKLLLAKPLNPFTESYPMPLDGLDFVFNIIGSGEKLLSGVSMSEKNGVISMETLNGKMYYAFRLYGSSVSPIYYFIRGANNNFVEKTFANCALTKEAPICIPMLGAILVVRSNGSALITALCVRSVSRGTVDETKICLQVPQGTEIQDKTSTVPEMVGH
jgi:hypothetical protein